MSQEPSGPVDPKQVAVRVEEAFRAVKQGDLAAAAALRDLGPAVVPALTPYVADPNEDVRRELVGLLNGIGGAAVAPLLIRALADPSDEIRERAAAALYARDDPEAVAAVPGVGEALRSAVGKRPTAPALLLLGHVPGPETERTLRRVAEDASSPAVKLHPWSTPVPASLPARVALSRLGDRDARRALQETIEAAGLPDLAFLLALMREIDAPEVLHTLKRRTLDDVRETRSGVPSGIGPKRRLCDDAVDAFVRELDLAVGFPIGGDLRYTADQIEEVRRAINEAIPR